jgi:hypothetical protein
MRKRSICIILFLFLFSSALIVQAQEKRIYNDGIIDYVPLTAQFVLSAEDFESTVKEIQYSVDGSAVTVYEGPIRFSSEGRHFIAYRAVDMTGNISNERIYSVIVDGSPPEGIASVEGTVYMDEEFVYLTKESAVVLWAEDNLSGVDRIYVKLDDMDFMPYTEPVVITREGYHSAETYAVDNVGNATPKLVVQGYVDSTPPVVSIVSDEDFVNVKNELYTNRTNEYTVRAYDEFAGVKEIQVSFDGSAYVTYVTPFRVQIPGFHTVRAKAVDNLGNVSDPVELSFYVDVQPPESKIGASVD